MCVIFEYLFSSLFSPPYTPQCVSSPPRLGGDWLPTTGRVQGASLCHPEQAV